MIDVVQTGALLEKQKSERSVLEPKLGELRQSRRLQKLTRSIESFLQNQLSRLESAVENCAQLEEKNAVLQRLLAEFEIQKREWEKKRLAEEQRLFEAGEKLVKGWQQLEAEKNKLGIN